MQSCMIIYIIMNCTSPRWYYPDRVPRVGTLCSSQPINGSPSAHLSMQFSDPNISNNVQKVSGCSLPSYVNGAFCPDNLVYRVFHFLACPMEWPIFSNTGSMVVSSFIKS